MEFLVWLVLLPIFVVIRAVVVGAPKLAEGVAQAEYALTNAETVYENELKKLKEKSNA